MAKPILGEKDFLNPEEAICYWKLSRKKFYGFLEETDGGDYLVFYNQRKLIIRVSFEQFLFKKSRCKGGISKWKVSIQIPH